MRPRATHPAQVLALAAETPDRPAIVQGDTTTSLGELARRGRACAAWLLREGLRPHDRVILWLGAGPDMAAALLGTWWAGGIPVLVDPAMYPEGYHHVLETVDPRFVLHASDPQPPAKVGPERDIADLPADLPLHRPHLPLPTDPASILFTSGSTGMPKGVVQSHGNLLRGARAVASTMALTSEDRLFCPVPWSFDYGFVNLQLTLTTGAVHLVPETPNLFALAAEVQRHHPTVLAAAPGVVPYLLEGLKKADTSALRAVTNTGGTIPRPLLDKLFGLLPQTRFFLNYGLTESYRTSCLDPALARDNPLSIGRAIPGVEVAVVDEDGRPVAPGEEGEIIHRGDYIFLGYWNRPEATAQRRRPDPLAPAGCPTTYALFTGDQGTVDDEGLLYYRGRRDRQLKSMGRRVSPTEVEALLHSSGLLEEVAVYGRSHPMLGDEICAAVVPKAGMGDVLAELRQYARALPAHLAPRRWQVRDKLPRTHTGKVDYKTVEADPAKP